MAIIPTTKIAKIAASVMRKILSICSCSFIISLHTKRGDNWFIKIIRNHWADTYFVCYYLLRHNTEDHLQTRYPPIRLSIRWPWILQHRYIYEQLLYLSFEWFVQALVCSFLLLHELQNSLYGAPKRKSVRENSAVRNPRLEYKDNALEALALVRRGLVTTLKGKVLKRGVGFRYRSKRINSLWVLTHWLSVESCHSQLLRPNPCGTFLNTKCRTGLEPATLTYSSVWPTHISHMQPTNSATDVALSPIELPTFRYG